MSVRSFVRFVRLGTLASLSVIAAACSSSQPAGTTPGSSNNTGTDGGSSAADGSSPAQGNDAGITPPLDASLPDIPLPSAKNPPAHGALFGAFVGVGQNDTGDFSAEEVLIGRHWVIDNRFYSYEDWINDRTKWDIANHKIPLVTWEPHENLDEIIAGTHDAMLHTRAQGAKALGTEIFLRWGHEMNGNWYPWAGANNGGATTGPAKYIAAYQHVHDLFVADGATNVVWIWCPLVTDVPSDAWNHWTNYYPGDAYVDWVGLDAYNWGSSSSCCTWESFSDLVTDLYKDYATKKPLMLPETASAEVGGSKGAWIDAMHQALMKDFPAIKAVVWFDINKETDWRVASSPASLAAYKSMGLDSYFNP